MPSTPLCWRKGGAFELLGPDDWTSDRRAGFVFTIVACNGGLEVACYHGGETVDRFFCLLLPIAKQWCQDKLNEIIADLIG